MAGPQEYNSPSLCMIDTNRRYVKIECMTLDMMLIIGGRYTARRRRQGCRKDDYAYKMPIVLSSAAVNTPTISKIPMVMLGQCW